MEEDLNNFLESEYWDNRYQKAETGWDLGQVSPPIMAYIDQMVNKDISILIPGCGNCYEAEYLINKGFTDVTLIDLSPTLVASLKEKYKGKSEINVLQGDFFELYGQFDLILEQTFFCALDPNLRNAYAKKMASLLNENGKLVGVMFDKEFEAEGPPFGGTSDAYRTIFSEYFTFKAFDKCHNSYSKRIDTEIFIILEKIKK